MLLVATLLVLQVSLSKPPVELKEVDEEEEEEEEERGKSIAGSTAVKGIPPEDTVDPLID